MQPQPDAPAACQALHSPSDTVMYTMGDRHRLLVTRRPLLLSAVGTRLCCIIYS